MNYKELPIVIVNFNRLTTLRGMVGHLQRLGYLNLWILDNQSTYPPLLEYYKEIENQVVIKRLDRNFIMYALYDCGIMNEFLQYPWIAYTDSDLILNPNLPDNFFEQLVGYTEKWGFKKAGFALKIDDLPNSDWGDKNRAWEEKFWDNKLEENVYNSRIDTTFAIIKPGSGIQFDALRISGDFEAQHYPWYVNFDNLDEEEKYYLETAHLYSTEKRYYEEEYKKQIIIK